MNSPLLPSSALAPSVLLESFEQPNLPTAPLLFGQQRVVDAFKLSCRTLNQHMYLADFDGNNKPELFKALTDLLPLPTSQYLVNKAGDFLWQDEALSNQVAQKSTPWVWLNGAIKKRDLIGHASMKNGELNYQAGALASAHYIFITADDLYKREPLWELVIQMLTDGFYRVHSELPVIPFNGKIILVGNGYGYSQLVYQEPPFTIHFSILAEMVSEIERTEEHETTYIAWLNHLAKLQQVELDPSALAFLIKYSCKLTEHQQRLSLCQLPFMQLMAQAAALTQQTVVSAESLQQSLMAFKDRHNASEQLSAQSFDDKFIMLQTEGEMIGQVNGLTVIDSPDYCYGEPARITTSVHYGDGEVADIERKSELGGNLHAKGMMILSSCLYRIFGKDAPLHLNANIVFEQSYQEIDGDSASAAEFCCLVSAIAEYPIQQSLAITGALDQFGHVQAIGGVNEKIVGFFNLCERRGLTGQQGVIIPKSNVIQLHLPEKIITAVEQQKFSIYAIEHVDQAVELLMGLPAGVADEDNNFAEDTLYGRVQFRLDRLDEPLTDNEPTLLQRICNKCLFWKNI
ncbi:S16 family serine protease [Shewanella marina]|uniref:S16 family serine protease n=1 Tax=Shewanella marina TaxID=487319 RepID=UPI00046F2527|nr:S16 family serine protease [Shewanella marina]